MTPPTRPAPTREEVASLVRQLMFPFPSEPDTEVHVKRMMDLIDAYAAARAEEARAEVTDQYMDGPSEGSLPHEKAMIEAAHEAGRREGLAESAPVLYAVRHLLKLCGNDGEAETAWQHAVDDLRTALDRLPSPPDIGDYVPTSSVSIEHAGYAPTAPAVERERTAREQGYDNGRANGIREAAAVAVRLDAEWQQADKTGYALVAEIIEAHIMALLSPSQPERG